MTLYNREVCKKFRLGFAGLRSLGSTIAWWPPSKCLEMALRWRRSRNFTFTKGEFIRWQNTVTLKNGWNSTRAQACSKWNRPGGMAHGQRLLANQIWDREPQTQTSSSPGAPKNSQWRWKTVLFCNMSHSRKFWNPLKMKRAISWPSP